MTEPKKRGRPFGIKTPIKAEADLKTRRTVRMTEEEWQYCESQVGGASAFIRSLIAKAQAEAEQTR